MAMDVKHILDGQGTQLLDIDLDVLEEELHTGGHDIAYVQRCQELIDDLRALRKRHAQKQEPTVHESPITTKPATENSLSPFNTTNETTVISNRNKFARDLLSIRDAGSQAGAFRKLLASASYVDEQFVDENIDLFTAEELKLLLRSMAFSERFLEKYFATLDHETLAKNQEFSEEFFISHYSDLDAQTVLKKGINTWRAKDQRSHKLDMFLRIKGVRY
ncbi:hypothetical protein [Collinsella intestinalis]|uniref:hypothetical protein n=1 Tax=Collinsella intestinalis TaxID=147207 RepID=UPI0025A36DF8|nr:hypothetical protein [Collinsella intestinalis]MDM8164262.1 hypothetical protein [Collinsella intestinalis]